MAGVLPRLWNSLGSNVKLNLGVLEVAYSDAQSGAKTTGDVAEILEAKYHVMETFYEAKKDKIDAILTDALGDMIADKFTGSMGGNSFIDAAEQIERLFRDFLDAGEMRHILDQMSESERAYYIDSTGGFSGAGSRGVNHRKKRPYSSKNKPRPAFIDSGLYQASFRAWFSKG